MNNHPSWDNSMQPPLVLHDSTCMESEADFLRMRTILSKEPDSIEKISIVDIGNIEVELTPVMLAIRSGHLQCVKFLVEHGARVKLRSQLGQDALLQAIKYRNAPIMKFLLELGMSPNYQPQMQNEDHDSSLCYDCSEEYLGYAVCTDSSKIVQTLIDAGAMLQDINYIVNSENHSLLTPAVVATYKGCVNSLETLLLNGAITDFDKEAKIELNDLKRDGLNLPLHLVLSYCDSLDVKIRIMYILYNFGLSFLKETCLGPNPITILENDDLLQEARIFLDVKRMDETKDFTKKNRQILATQMKDLASTPMSLKSQARLFIAKQLGQRFVYDVSKLPDLPHELLEFVAFKSDT